MGNHAVTLRVTPFLRIECKFWLTDDGWNGSCELLSIAVHAATFEYAKSEMEIALGKHVESFLREPKRPNEEHIGYVGIGLFIGARSARQTNHEKLD